MFGGETRDSAECFKRRSFEVADVSEMVASVVHEAEAMQLDVVVREYDPERDRLAVEDMERCCEVSCSAEGKMALFTDLLGDPFSRVRHCPCALMLVCLFLFLYLLSSSFQ